MKRIDQKIVGYKVITEAEQKAAKLEVMHEDMARPAALHGTTYKLKPPQAEYALYLTINNIVLNKGTENEEERVFEIFLHSKNMQQFQWIIGMTRIMSSVFRSGASLEYIVEEMKQVFDPRGGYFKKGGVFMPSLVAEIGHTLERHLISIGMLKKPELDEHVKEILAEKRAQFEAAQAEAVVVDERPSYPEKATVCKICGHKAVMRVDNCEMCLNCSDSKCG
ncbi:MAG: NrdJb [Candidatus Omnitrophica bacterium]|nr:NrdJb [Candidatus Omnitrophota bacterium]